MAGSDRLALVTGGAGFLGRHLADRLLRDGWAVRSLDLRPAPRDDVASTVGDVCDAACVRDACRDVDAVFHLAALLPQRHAPANRMQAVNEVGAHNVLASAADAAARAVVVLSSTEVYGVPAVTPCPEDAPLRPIGEYGRNKVRVEAVAARYANDGLHVPVLRPCTIVGPGMPEPLLSAFVAATRRNLPLVVVGRGANRFQLVAASDVADACVRAVDVPDASGLPVNIGSAEVPTMLETARAAKARVGSRSPVLRVPERVVSALVHGLARVGRAPLEPEHLAIVLRDYVFDIDRARNVLGWKPDKDNVEALLDCYPAA